MKKLLAMFAILASIGFVACSDDDDSPVGPTGDPELKLTSESEMNFTADGGRGTITFLLKNKVDGVEPTATCAAEWVSDLKVGTAVTFTVAENDAEDARQADITVSYGDQSFKVTVKQAGVKSYDAEFELTVLQGVYYSDFEADGIYNYQIFISKNGVTQSSSGIGVKPSENVYSLDIYSDVAPTDPKSVPVGTYTFDATDSCEPGTLGSSYSWYAETNTEGQIVDNQPFIAGSVTVSEGNIEATLTLEDGTVHHIVYKGSLTLNALEGEEQANSNLTGDVTFEDVNVEEQFTPYGDYFENGMNVFLGQALSDTHSMTFQLMTPGDAENLEGIYEVVPEDGNVDPTKHYFFAGGVNGSQITATWYVNQRTNEMAAIVGGTIEIQVWASGITFYDIDVVDGAGNSIKGTFIGTPAVQGEDVEMAVEDGQLLIEDYGDGYQIGMQNYTLTMVEADGEGHGLMVDILLPFESESIAGTYISAYASESVVMGGTVDHVFVPGDYSLYFPISGGVATGNMFVIEDGEITIEVLEDNEYSFTFDCVLDSGNTLVGTFKAVDMYAGAEASAKVKPQLSTLKNIKQKKADSKIAPVMQFKQVQKIKELMPLNIKIGKQHTLLAK